MKRSFRAPAICWMLAAAVFCAVAGSGGRGALAQTPQEQELPAPGASVGEPDTGVTTPASETADRSVRPADICLTVKNFDFDERPLGNYEDTPMYWQQMTGEGLPAFSDGRFDDQVGHQAPPSFLFTLRGGSIGYEYDHADLAIAPDSDYLITGYVRADGLEDAAALVACYLMDTSGQRLAGSEQVSRPIRSLARTTVGGAGEWQRVEIPLHIDAPEAATVRLQLWVLQNYVFVEPDESAVDPITRQEVDARVWFDDLALVRLPRARLALATPGGLIEPGTQGTLDLAMHNPAPAALRADLLIVDDAGHEHFRTALELPPGSTRTFAVDLPALPPGLYEADLDLVARDAGRATENPGLIQRSTRFAVLPELSVAGPPHTEKGIDLGCWPGKDPLGAEALAAGLGCGTVKIGLPMTNASKDGWQADYFRQVRDLAQTLETHQMSVVGVVLPPPSAEGPPSARTLHRLLASDSGWSDQLGPLLLYFGGHVAWWQLGDETTELREAVDWRGVVGLFRERLKRFLIAPQLVVPRSVFDAAPAAELLAPLADGSEHAAPAGGSARKENVTDATSFWVPTAVPARDLPWVLAFLFGRPWEGAPEAVGQARRSAEQSPAPWLSLAIDRDPGLSQSQRLADLARRFVLASAANAARVCVPAPFELTHTGGTTGWQPTNEYIPLRTLVRHLSGLHAVAALRLPNDAIAVLFGAGERHTLAVWTWQQDSDAATADLYVGVGASAYELSGAPRPLEFDGPLAHVPLTAVPLIVTGVDAPLLLLQDSFQIAPTFIQSHDLAAAPVLSLHNPYAVALSGTIELQASSGWEVTPNPVHVDLAPGQILTQALAIRIPPRPIAGQRQLEVDFRLSQPERVALHFTVPLELGLQDLALEASAWWDGDDLLVEQSLRNLSSVPVSFNAFCQPPEHAQLEGAFLDVPPGEVRMHTYRLPAARALAGARLWMGIAEIGGHRALDQLVSIPR